MASPAVAMPNGLPDPAHSVDVDMADAAQPPSASSASTASASSSTKRKREETEQPNGVSDSLDKKPVTNGNTNGVANTNGTAASKPTESEQDTIRNYLVALERFDATPSILKRPLPDPDSYEEPSAKRKKAEDGSAQPSIADKAAKDAYTSLEAIVTDIKASVQDQLAELRAVQTVKDSKANDESVAQTVAFSQKAHQLFRQEVTYPRPTTDVAVLRAIDSSSDLQSNASGNMVLSVYGEAPRPRQLYSSLQQRVPTPGNPKGAIQSLRENGLPNGIKTAKAIPFFFPSAIEKDKKAKTLGELFPAPRNLPSLQPPKAPKSTTKGVQVGWHRPELTEKSKYRAGSYFSQIISTGRWLDYSNAAPPSQIMTKQRERALSLAGSKPSSSELETSEMEALFRGAFSSFAPSKDDSAAMISSGLISQTMWWQKVGKRSFDRLVDAEVPETATDEADEVKLQVPDLDDDIIQEAIETWDENNIDPSLEAACCPKKPDEEKDVDDILQEISDMIQTLVSFQKNRNLALPSAANQSRYTADPSHSDMLTNGSPVQPSEEETLTYETLKAQLALVIQMLPPYAVARLNSDKLEELSISTKLEIRADEYQGVMEEDESAARARAAQQAAAAPRPTAHRSSSSSSNLQYGASRPSIPGAGYYGTQSPARTPSGIQRPPPNMPQAYSQPRPPSNAAYRPQNGYPGSTSFAQQLAKAQQSFTQTVPYAATPPQARPSYAPQPSYHNMGGANPPRYPSHTPNAQTPSYQQLSFPQHPQQQSGTPSQAQYSPYTNGTGNAIPARTHSPQVAHQQPQYMQHQGYNPSSTPTRQPSYGSPGLGGSQQRFFPPAANLPQQSTPGHQQQQGQGQQGLQGQQGQQGQQGAGFHTSLNPLQVQQAMDQAKARFDAQNKAQRSTDGVRTPIPVPGSSPAQGPVGLGGIGLNSEAARTAAARANASAGGVNYNTPSLSPRPQVNSPALSLAPPVANGSPASAVSNPGSVNGGVPPPTHTEA